MENHVIPSWWEVVSLSDVSNKLVDGSHNPPAKQSDGFPMLSAVNINDNKILFSDYRFISEDAFILEDRRTRIEPGDVLLTIVGAIGRTAVVPEKIPKFTLQRSVAVITPRHISSKFLMYQFESPQITRYFKKNARGTAQKGVYLKTLGNTQIWLPPLNEQHRIVAKIEALFSELDKGIESFKTAREQLKIYRQALLKHAFSGKLTEQWRAENAAKLESAETLLQRIQTERQQRYQQQLKDWEDKSPSIPLLQRGKLTANHQPCTASTTIPPFEKGGTGGISKPKPPKTLPLLTAEELAELPELPEGWVYSRLGALIDEPTYGTAKKCDYDTDGIGVLRIPNVVSGRIDASDMKFAQFEKNEIASYKLDAGDILLIRSNGSISIVGRCALVSEYDINYLYAGYLIKLRPNESLIAPAFLINQISAHSLRKQIEAKAKSTSGVNNINSGEIQSLIIALCSIEEQKKTLTEVEANLSICDQLDQTITTALQQAEALRQSILKKAFSGQLVPQEPNDEPASVLRERIRAENAQADKQPARHRGKTA